MKTNQFKCHNPDNAVVRPLYTCISLTRPARLFLHSTDCLGWSWRAAGCQPWKRTQETKVITPFRGCIERRINTVDHSVEWMAVTSTLSRIIDFRNWLHPNCGSNRCRAHTGIKSFFFSRTTSPTSMFLHFDSWNLKDRSQVTVITAAMLQLQD